MGAIDVVQAKIITREALFYNLSFWKFKGKKIVFTNGCFDIIHRGHIEYLAKASDFGDVLIIGLNSDNSVKRIKGEGRPVQDEYSRALILSSFRFINNIILFEEDTPYELIEFVQPDILVKGSDYKTKEIVGYDIVKSNGGRVETIDFVEGFSTSKILKKI